MHEKSIKIDELTLVKVTVKKQKGKVKKASPDYTITSSMTSDNLLKHIKPQVTHLKNGDDNSTRLVRWVTSQRSESR